MTETEQKFIHVMKRFKQLVFPHKTNLKKIRLGEERDGGYVIAQLENDDYDALYSYGCDDNITFENAFHDRYKKKCYVYDPFKGITNKPEFIEFFDEGISHVNEKKGDKKFGTLDEHIVKNGHTDSKNLFMQIDVEGSEWGIFSNKQTIKYLTNFSQVVIEFHLPLSAGVLLKMEPYYEMVFRNLNEHFVCVHFHGNNAFLQPWADGYIPRAFEVTYVRKDLIKEYEKETQPSPVPGLDFACATDRPDIKVDYWLEKSFYE